MKFLKARLKKQHAVFLILAGLNFFWICPCLIANSLKISQIIDNETLQLSDGEKVHLVGVEAINPNSRETADFIQKLIQDKEVQIELIDSKKNPYGQPLAYVWYELFPWSHIKESKLPDGFEVNSRTNNQGYAGTFVFLNATLIKSGYAKVAALLPNPGYQELFLRLQQEAKENKRGLWK